MLRLCPSRGLHSMRDHLALQSHIRCARLRLPLQLDLVLLLSLAQEQNIICGQKQGQ